MKCGVWLATDKQSSLGKQPYRRMLWKFDFWRLDHGFVGTLEKGISALTVCGRLQHPRIRLFDSSYYSLYYGYGRWRCEANHRSNDGTTAPHPQFSGWRRDEPVGNGQSILIGQAIHQRDKDLLELRQMKKTTKARQQENVMSRSRSRYR